MRSVPTARQSTRYVAEAAAALGGIDVLVNNASGFGTGDDEAGWAAGLAVDVMAMVRASRAALPQLEAAPGSCIINIRRSQDCDRRCACLRTGR